MIQFPRHSMAILAVWMASARLQAQDGAPPRNARWTEATVQAKAAFNSGDEKIDPALLVVASTVSSKGITSLDDVAKTFGVETDGDLVSVALIANDQDDIAQLRKDVTARGGQISTSYKNHLYALMPPSQLGSLGKLDELYFAGRPTMSYPDSLSLNDDPKEGEVLLEGVLKIKADRLHKAGVRGQGVKVGILDFGYEKYDELKAAGKVPTPVATKTFNHSGRMENGVVHGTACAEIIHAMAPDAQLYLATAGEGGSASEGQIIAAALWLKAQGVDIISYSGGAHGGPINGTSLEDILVAEVTKEHRILWVNAAGNEGNRHLLVTFPGGAGDWIPIRGQTQFVKLTPQADWLTVDVDWDDWGNDPEHPAATQDVDIMLMRTDKDGNILEQKASLNAQSGRMPPSESIETPAIKGEVYFLGLHPTKVTRPIRVHINVKSTKIEPYDPTGSIGIPATSPNALSVGAVDVTTDKIEVYSSRGPTDDNRAKPEISSYDNTLSTPYGGRFTGTSAACPHVSGLAALLKSQQRDGDADALRTRILAAVRPSDAADPGFGAGITDLASLAAGNGKAEDASSTSETVELPEALGGNIKASALEEMRGMKGDQPFDVKVRLGRDGNPPLYRIGDDLRLGFSTAEDGYCTLINRNAEGQYTVLPLESDRLEAGHKYVYPDKIRVSAPTGSEEFLFICAKDRVDLNRWKRSGDEAGVAIDIAHYEVAQ